MSKARVMDENEKAPKRRGTRTESARVEARGLAEVIGGLMGRRGRIS
jgi:hypothetical protein